MSRVCFPFSFARDHVQMPDELGPPSLTNPILKMPDGSLAMSIETNKHYDDYSAWEQKAVFLYSHDMGKSWSLPVIAAEDSAAKIFNWDLRCGVGSDGRVASFAWTYDTLTGKYLNIPRRISGNGGHSWDAATDLGFADQAGPPAMLPDGRVVLAWVDRFEGRNIRARIAPAIDAPFDANSEVVLYNHDDSKMEGTDNLGNLLVGMEMWRFGLPFATALNNGDVLVTYYAGDRRSMGLYYAKLSTL